MISCLCEAHSSLRSITQLRLYLVTGSGQAAHLRPVHLGGGIITPGGPLGLLRNLQAGTHEVDAELTLR